MHRLPGSKYLEEDLPVIGHSAHWVVQLSICVQPGAVNHHIVFLIRVNSDLAHQNVEKLFAHCQPNRVRPTHSWSVQPKMTARFLHRLSVSLALPWGSQYQSR